MKGVEIDTLISRDSAVVSAHTPCYPLAPGCGKRAGIAHGSVTGKME